MMSLFINVSSYNETEECHDEDNHQDFNPNCIRIIKHNYAPKTLFFSKRKIVMNVTTKATTNASVTGKAQANVDKLKQDKKQ